MLRASWVSLNQAHLSPGPEPIAENHYNAQGDDEGDEDAPHGYRGDEGDFHGVPGAGGEYFRSRRLLIETLNTDPKGRTFHYLS